MTKFSSELEEIINEYITSFIAEKQKGKQIKLDRPLNNEYDFTVYDSKSEIYSTNSTLRKYAQNYNKKIKESKSVSQTQNLIKEIEDLLNQSKPQNADEKLEHDTIQTLLNIFKEKTDEDIKEIGEKLYRTIRGTVLLPYKKHHQYDQYKQLNSEEKKKYQDTIIEIKSILKELGFNEELINSLEEKNLMKTILNILYAISSDDKESIKLRNKFIKFFEISLSNHGTYKYHKKQEIFYFVIAVVAITVTIIGLAYFIPTIALGIYGIAILYNGVAIGVVSAGFMTGLLCFAFTGGYLGKISYQSYKDLKEYNKYIQTNNLTEKTYEVIREHLIKEIDKLNKKLSGLEDPSKVKVVLETLTLELLKDYQSRIDMIKTLPGQLKKLFELINSSKVAKEKISALINNTPSLKSIFDNSGNNITLKTECLNVNNIKNLKEKFLEKINQDNNIFKNLTFLEKGSLKSLFNEASYICRKLKFGNKDIHPNFDDIISR